MAERVPRIHPIYADRVRKHSGGSTRDLIQAAKEVAAMMQTPGWGRLMEIVQGRRDDVLADIVHGPVLEQSEYASKTALARGLDEVLGAAQTVLYVAEEAERGLEKKGEED